jgi:hypothetical protein
VCFPEAERRRRIPAGVVVTVETISTVHQLLPSTQILHVEERNCVCSLRVLNIT